MPGPGRMWLVPSPCSGVALLDSVPGVPAPEGAAPLPCSAFSLPI